MSTRLDVTAVVYDASIYPRAEWSQSTVNRYADAIEAGADFPPITLERATGRLLDGMHRWQAHKQALQTTIAVVYVDVPDDVPAKLYAASLSATHGDRMSGTDLRQIAREVAEANPDYDLATLARYACVTRKTVSKWVCDIVEHRRSIQRLQALLLRRAGWSQTQIADHLGKGQKTISEWLVEMGSDTSPLAEDLLREAAAGLPDGIDIDTILETIRQERIFATWSNDERGLLERLRSGETIVVSMRGNAHTNLIAWADAAGLYVRIDRKSEWGNPFELPGDGDRDTVIGNYETHYLPYKPSLVAKVDTLRGKALGCWCAPEACHGDVLKERAEQ
jgi:transcriptional regulator with XRE-family HTH domain